MRISDWSSDVCSSDLGEASGDSGAIVVNGQKESYKAEDATAATKLPLSLKETPQSITVITRQRIEDFNLNTITDVLNQTPGVTSRSLDSSRIGFYARGFSVQNFQLDGVRSEEHTSELQSLMRISYAVFCLKKK